MFQPNECVIIEIAGEFRRAGLEKSARQGLPRPPPGAIIKPS
jgi:hypothetical protein